MLTKTDSFIVLIKSEKFGGEFVELLGDMKVDSSSVVEVVVDHKSNSDVRDSINIDF